MIRFITENFVPVKIHVKEQPEGFERFKAQWTPTQIILDPEGVERHRIEGFLPVDDLLAQLEMGLAKIAFEKKDFAEAERHYQSVCETHPHSGAAPEACYWMGVARYKATNDARHLNETATRMHERYPDTEWARKASVWGPEQTARNPRAA